jgi:uncharacterized protein (DUF1501 family)
MKRNEFIKRSALATVGTMLIPDFLKAYERRQLQRAVMGDKILVVVQLSGGNDGLNTIVPFRNDLYYRARPRIAIQPERVLPLNDELGFHPALEKLRELYDEGLVTVLNNVGYPNPDRSHFRSMDIWQTASDASEYRTSGWIGRYLDAQCHGTCQPHAALEVDDTLSLALKGERVKGLAVTDPQRLYAQTQNSFYAQLAQANQTEFGPVGYLYKTLAETVSSAEYLNTRTRTTGTAPAYPASELAARLRTVGRLIRAGVATNVYYVSLSGFDTHVNQPGQQERLLRVYAEAVHAFLADVKAAGRAQDVAVLTFSEFGRRVQQNASNGTDHGTANTAFLLGAGLKPDRSLERVPDLTNLDEGDLRYRIDFRELYASLLDQWLGVGHEAVLGQKFGTLRLT